MSRGNPVLIFVLGCTAAYFRATTPSSQYGSCYFFCAPDRQHNHRCVRTHRILHTVQSQCRRKLSHRLGRQHLGWRQRSGSMGWNSCPLARRTIRDPFRAHSLSPHSDTRTRDYGSGFSERAMDNNERRGRPICFCH